MTGDKAIIINYLNGDRLSLGLQLFLLVVTIKAGYALDTPEPGEPLPMASQQALFMSDGGHVESGSGQGPSFPYPSGAPQPASAFDSSTLPLLVTARCWNNYDSSDDCKQLNVITDDGQVAGGANQQQDSIITPTLVYDGWPATPSPPLISEEAWLTSSPESIESVESSSSVRIAQTPPTSNQVHQNRQKIGNQGWHPPVPETVTDQYTVGPVWQIPDEPVSSMKSVFGDQAYFGTPKPALGRSTTTSRICRDQNDDDCDEPEDDAGDGDADTVDDVEDEQRTLEEGGEKKLQATKTGIQLDQDSNQEFGSGQGPNDDNEDDADDDDGGGGGQTDSGGVWDMNGSSSTSNDNSSIPHRPQQKTSSSSTTPESLMVQPTFVSVPQHETKASPATQEAEIEVVVHPMLPPSFPKFTPPPISWLPTQASVTSTPEPTQQKPTSTTIIPDDTYKSKPVFPSTNKPAIHLDNQASTEWSPPNNDIDLATFKSVPIAPVSESEPTFQRTNLDSLYGNNSMAGDNQQVVPERHKFEPPILRPSQLGASQRFENAWLEKPQRSTYSNSPPIRSNQHEFMANNQQASLQQPVSIKRSSEMLPTLLVIASVLVFLAAMVVLVMMALWRRNMSRQRALLLAKSGLMNGPAGSAGMFPPGQPGHHQMVTSLQRQAGLLSTYAPSLATKIGTSIVHRNPADDQERLTEIGGHNEIGTRFAETGREDRETGENSNSQQTCSTTTDNEETSSSSGGGSQETNNPPPIRQPQDHSPAIVQRQPQIQQQPITDRPMSRQQQYLPDSIQRHHLAQAPLYVSRPAPVYPVAGLDREPFATGPTSMQQQHQMMPPQDTNDMRRISISRSVEALNQYPLQQQQQQANHNTMRPRNPYDPMRRPPDSYGDLYGPPDAYNRDAASSVMLLPRTGVQNPLINPPGAPILASNSRLPNHHLTRAPYSTDDSSSFVTVSPSLARTSSSSSFALNNGLAATTIQPKPLVDAAGRMFNSYAPPTPHFGIPGEPTTNFGSSDIRPPERSEAWYV